MVLGGRLSLALIHAAAHHCLLLPALHALLHTLTLQLRGNLCRTCHDSLQLLLLTPGAKKLNGRQPTQSAVPERATAWPSIWWPLQTPCWAICSSPVIINLSQHKTVAVTQREAHSLPCLQIEQLSASHQKQLSRDCFRAQRPCPRCQSRLRRRQLPP